MNQITDAPFVDAAAGVVGRTHVHESAALHVAGTATYALPARMIQPMATYLSITSNGVTTDRIMTPISTYEYAALPDKTQTGVPNSFWYERTSTPKLNVWPVPDTAW